MFLNYHRNLANLCYFSFYETRPNPLRCFILLAVRRPNIALPTDNSDSEKDFDFTILVINIPSRCPLHQAFPNSPLERKRGEMRKKLDQQRYRYARLAVSEAKLPFADDFDNYKQYYSPERSYSTCIRVFGKLRFAIAAILLVILFIALTYQKPFENTVEPEDEDHFEHTAMKTLGGHLKCDSDVLKPSETIPTNVNQVRPADIKAIGSLGDSITAAAGSKNYDDDARGYFAGNSFFIGGDEKASTHLTLANIMREVNPNLIGSSHGRREEDKGFNVAVGGMTTLDLPRQANDLVDRMNSSKEVDIKNDWKLITIFIGTNDIGNLSCYKENRPVIPYVVYKAKIEEAIAIMRNNLPRSIVTILSMWNSQLTIEATSLIEDGKRKSCGKGSIKQRDDLIDSYQRAAYEIQNEKKFDSEDFTVVVQSYLDDIKDAFRDKSGKYDKSFYADDIFHLSKYGNAIMGKYLWNGLLEPVGKKNKKADLANDEAPLACPDKAAPFIRTLGNS